MRLLRPELWSAVDKRLLKVGLPLLVSNAVLLPLPVLARLYLGEVDYATWALLMTVVMGAALFDLGGTTFIQSAGYGVWVRRRLYLQSVGLATAGVAVVTGVALLAALALGESLAITTSRNEFALMLVMTGVATGFRQAWVVMLARLQVSEEYKLRTELAVAQALMQVGACWAALILGFGLWALPLSLVVSAVPFLFISHVVLARRTTSLPDAIPSAHLAGFASVRTLSTMLATASSQADRWVLAWIGPASFVSSYDLAVRFAAVPLAFVMTLFSGVVAEAGAIRGTEARRSLVRSVTKRFGAVTGVLVVIGLIGVLLAGPMGLSIVDRQFVLLFVMALLWQSVNALTGPTTMTFIGSGTPANEFRYVIPTVLCNATGWAIGVWSGQPWAIPIATLTSIALWSCWYIYYGIRVARY